MAKLTILLASFIALLFLVDASIYRTTITVDEEDAENQWRPGGEQSSCQQQIQQQQNLRQCQSYIREQSGSRRRDNEEEDNQYRSQRECCRQLQRMETRCRCDGLRRAVQRLESQGQIQGEDVRDAYRVASELPSECGVSPSRCQFRSRWLF